MAKAFLMLGITGDVDDDFIKKLREQIPQITEVKKVYGPFDIVFRLESRSLEELKESTTKVLSEFEHFRTDKTIIIAEEW